MNKTDTTHPARMRLDRARRADFTSPWKRSNVVQVSIYLYPIPEACPLDELEQDLGLSKASVCVVARQLEQHGLLQRVWVKGKCKRYYRSTGNIAHALRQGLLSLVHQKICFLGDELKATKTALGFDAEQSFYVPDEVKELFTKRVEELKSDYDQWQNDYSEWQKGNPDLDSLREKMYNKDMPDDLEEQLIGTLPEKETATRNYSGIIMQKSLNSSQASSEVQLIWTHQPRHF